VNCPVLLAGPVMPGRDEPVQLLAQGGQRLAGGGRRGHSAAGYVGWTTAGTAVLLSLIMAAVALWRPGVARAIFSAAASDDRPHE
jgi:hypothetical protein